MSRVLLFLGVLFLVAQTLSATAHAEEARQITQWGITWTFDKPCTIGKFVTGDYWVIGPVTVVGITTDLHAAGFTPKSGEDGSMVNPGTGEKQGYDNRLNSYDAGLNAALIGGKAVSADNPLVLKPNSSLVSMVSWLYRSEKDAEPGIPKFDGMTKAPRPVTRSGAILTVLSQPPPKDAFRPPYVGNDKSIKYTFDKLDLSKLKNLAPVANTPDPAALAKQMERPWIDHVHEWYGAMVHPSDNMPNYGRDMNVIMIQVALMVNLDFTQLPGKPAKDKLLIELVQYGIDSAGIADNGGGWPANGGHGMGRKWPILFAGIMLNDAHMKDVGHWKTEFHEDEQTFIVSQAEVDITNSPKWKPDKRGGNPTPYKAADIGMPEWGIRHANEPQADNAEWNAPYRLLNAIVIPGFVLSARIMGQEEAWNHKPLFAYGDRLMKAGDGKSGVKPPPFVTSMWKEYAAGVQEPKP